MAEPGQDEPGHRGAPASGKRTPHGRVAAKISRAQWLAAGILASVGAASIAAVLAGGLKSCSTVETTGSQTAGGASTQSPPPETSTSAPPAGSAAPTSAPTQPAAPASAGTTATISAAPTPGPSADTAVVSTVETCQPQPALPWVVAGTIFLAGLVLFGSRVAEVTLGPFSFKQFEKELEDVKSEVAAVRLIALASANASSQSAANTTANVYLPQGADVDVAKAVARVIDGSPNLALLDTWASELAGKTVGELVEDLLVAWQELQFDVARVRGLGVHGEPGIERADLELWYSLFHTELTTLGMASAQLVNDPWRFDKPTLARLVAVARLVRRFPSTIANERARLEGLGETRRNPPSPAPDHSSNG